ncbi:uncharacterized protein [Branchiostoma lanceolatum]|uniref:uncharacterized protein isoform X2 n=1 Tax=Branchiostoma lanceolatum TaxID=7740 RepID=UPI003456BF08
MQVTMASKLLLSVFLLACLGVCHGRHHKKHPQGDHPSTYSASNGGDLEPSCTGECPEFELLCWTPEYDVRRCKSALWVSTTMSDLSLSQASGRGRKRLHDYFGGANDKRLKMSYTVPMVTQTRAPSESPVREITVSMLLPKEVAKNPPKPVDPMVVIDLVAETILYVKKFGGRSPRVGFVADLEAKNFFKTLRNNKEPSYEEDNYYYVAQYGSSDSFNHNMYNEIWIYAMNERTYKWLEFNDLTAGGQGLPKCLRGDEEPIVWEKMDQSDIPMLTREQCSTTYCQAPKKCPKIETSGVKGVDDKSIKLKQYKDIRALGYVPPTCYYDTAVHASAGPLLKSLDNAGVPAPDVAGTLTVAIEKREELDGVNSCQKLFKVWYVAGGGTGSPEDLTLLKTENGFQTPKTVEALHARQYTTVYTKCFGGNAYYEPSTITSTAKKLMERLRDKKKCILGDHVGVAEYHPQSRLFDRYNEIDLDADLDCSDQEGRPPFTFHLPVSKDYSRTEARPSLGDQCDTHECPKMTTIMGLENNLKIIEYAPASWFYSKSPSKSCSNMEAFYKALNPLLSYLNGKNEDNSKIDMTKPLYGKVNMFEQRCEKVTTLSTMVPEKFADNPPKPIDDTVSFDHPAVESRFFRSLYKGRYSSGELERRLLDLINDLDNLKPFGVQYNIQDIWLGTFDDPGKDERLFEYIIELIKVPKEGQDDFTSEEAGENQNEDTSDGKVALPKPEGCSESICPTVYVTKNHSNFLEVLLPKRRSACHRAKLCGYPYPFGRQLTRPLVKYFHGDNSDNKTITNFAVPLYKARVYSAEESEKGIGQCEREYEVCLRLPQEYEGKELPKPTGEGVATFTTTEGFHVYATPVKGPFIVSEETQKLMQTLDEGSVQYDKTWVGFFTYKEPFDDPQERITYFVFLKQGEELDGEGEPNELEIEKKEGDMKTQPEKTEG